MIKQVSGRCCCKDPPKENYTLKKKQVLTEKEPFGRGICNNVCSFLPLYLTLLCQRQLFNVHVGGGHLTLKNYYDLAVWILENIFWIYFKSSILVSQAGQPK